jgi:hypothetical protein
VGSPAVLEQVHQRGILANGDTLTYAFALDIGTHRGRPRISHGGFHRGFRTNTVSFPEDDLGIVLLSNLESFDPAEKALQVADLYFAGAVGPLADYAGVFYSEELATTYRLAAEDGRLVARHQRNPDIVLQPRARDYFEGDAEFFGTVQFIREAGRVVGFRVSTDRVRKLVFEKIDDAPQAAEDG